MPEVLTLRVSEVITETADACSLVFDASPEQVPYRPGQFLTLELPGGARSYSLASSPHTDPQLKVTIKRVAGGYGSNWLCNNVRASDELRVIAPAGVFTPRTFANDLLLMAAGSGITPVISIAKSALVAGESSVVLFYANRDERSVIFGRELTDLAEQHPTRFTVLHWLESVQGLPTSAAVSGLLWPYRDREAFVCGPTGFMDAARATCDGLEMPGSLVHFEKFASLSGDPFAQPALGSTVADDDAGCLYAEIDGDAIETAWPRQARMLDVLVAAGADAPFSCREGSCGACACRVIEGEVTQPDTDVLDSVDLAQGWVLACQATRVSDRVKISYEE